MADKDQLEIWISANSDGVKAGMNEAQKTVQSSTAAINESSARMAEESKKAADGLAGAFASMADKIKGSSAEAAAASNAASASMADGLKAATAGVNSSMGMLGGAFSFVSKNLGMLAGIAAGGALFKEAIDKTNDWNGEVGKLSKSLGLSLSEASQYAVAMRELGIQSDTLVTATQKVSQQIMKGGEGFKTLGVAVKDASTGGFRPAVDIISETIDKIKEIHNPILQNQAGMAAFGKSWADVKPLMKLTGDALSEAKEKMRQLGLEVTPEKAANTKAYKEGMREFGLAMDALAVNVGSAVLPAFAEMAKGVADLAVKVVEVLKPAFDLLAFVVLQVMDVFKGWLSYMLSFKDALVSVIGPAFHDVFGESIPADFDILQKAMASVKISLVAIKVTILDTFEILKAAVLVTAEILIAFGKAAKAALTLDFAGAKRAIDEGASAIEGRIAQSFDRIKKIGEENKKVMDELWSPSKKPETKDQRPVGEGPQYDFTKKTKPDSQMGAFQAELDKMKLDFRASMNEIGSLRQYDQNDELAFWQKKIQTVAKGSDDYNSILGKILTIEEGKNKQSYDQKVAALRAQEAEQGKNFEAMVAFAQQEKALAVDKYGAESKQAEDAQARINMINTRAMEERRRLLAQYSGMARDVALDDVAIDEEAFKSRVAMGIVSNAEILKQEQDFEDRKHEIKLAALNEQLKEIDPLKDPVAYSQILRQIQSLEIQHNATMRKLNEDYANSSRMQFENVMNSAQSSLSSSIASVIKGTQTMAQAIKSVFVSIAGAMVDMFAQWAAKQIMQSILGVTTAATSARAEIAANAAVAGSAAFASTAAIPLVGPAEAPAAAAAAYAGAMSFQSAVPAARNGFDIPAGVNPLTQLHEKEMVLPAKQADVIRNMADQGGGAGGATNIHIHAVDAPSVKRLFTDHGSALVEALRGQNRRFAF